MNVRQAYLSPRAARRARCQVTPSSTEISTRSIEPSPTQARPRSVMREEPLTLAFGAGNVIIDFTGQASAETVSGGIFCPGSTGHFGVT